MTGMGSHGGTTQFGCLDLRDPLDLERAEESAAAAARAIAHNPGLRFRGHLLHLGARLAPARAPHVRSTGAGTALISAMGMLPRLRELSRTIRACDFAAICCTSARAWPRPGLLTCGPPSTSRTSAISGARPTA